MGVCIETRINKAHFVRAWSHPIWVCVLKLFCCVGGCCLYVVTPYMGVCIETINSDLKAFVKLVTPYMGVCIETNTKKAVSPQIRVTPYMGVCIETSLPPISSGLLTVTPYMGVCIETNGTIR